MMFMTNIGIFLGDSHSSSLIAVASANETTEAKLSKPITIVEDFLFDRKLLSGRDYLHYSDPASMREDEDESDTDKYDTTAEEIELLSLAELKLDTLEDYNEFALEVLKGFGVFTEEEFSAKDEAKLLTRLAKSFEKNDTTTIDESSIEAGTLVYAQAPSNVGFGKAKMTAFNEEKHDAKAVILASLVNETPTGEFVIYPTAPDRVIHDGAYWGQFKGETRPAVFFRGKTKAIVLQKAAVYEAWVARFGS